jgi:hypothetical protein
MAQQFFNPAFGILEDIRHPIADHGNYLSL